MSSVTADEALALLRSGNHDFLNDAPNRAPTMAPSSAMCEPPVNPANAATTSMTG